MLVLQADGNCMYRALAHQCQLHRLPSMSDPCQPAALYLALRQEAAKYISGNATTFLPFIVDADSNRTPDDQLEDFCAGVEGEEWGSHVELHALSESLGAIVQVRFSRCSC